MGRWHKGHLADLARLADDVGANETYAITDILQWAILAASDRIDLPTGQALAKILHLPWDPKKGTYVGNLAREGFGVKKILNSIQNKIFELNLTSNPIL